METMELAAGRVTHRSCKDASETEDDTGRK